eukprot:Selendium_serpulae@DN1814_c0_g1_i6.p1
MKVVEQEHVFQHDWNTITAAFLQKYPNPLQPHVRRIDTVAREIDAQRAVIRTRRILQVEYGLPAWVMRLFNIKQEGFVVEDCVVDVKNKHLKLYSENITYNGLLSVKESCSYRAHPANPAKTLYKANSSYKVFAPGLSCVGQSSARTCCRQRVARKSVAGSERDRLRCDENEKRERAVLCGAPLGRRAAERRTRGDGRGATALSTVDFDMRGH